MGKHDLEVAKNILRLRLSQMIINEKYKAGQFKIPIHLALGHETIAVAVDLVMHDNDKLVLSHRNIHYNLARIRTLKEEIEEYLKYARKLMSDIHILRGDGPVSPGPTGKKSFGAMDLPETPGKTSSAGLAAQSAVLDAPKPTGDSGGSITGPAQDTWKSSIVSPKLLTAISQAA